MEFAKNKEELLRKSGIKFHTFTDKFLTKEELIEKGILSSEKKLLKG
ncbi:hypothetical protein KBB25_00305 [Candidatus Gracilibacteria bacterium]|nr:hypothetical protein [Candidatus Gracilibacteria bacterium]